MRWIGYLISDVLLYPCSITIQILSPWSMARIYLLACLYFLLRRWLKLLSWITVIYSCWKLFGIGRWANNSYIIFIFKSLRMLDLKCFKLKELWFSMLLSCLYSAFLFSNLNWSNWFHLHSFFFLAIVFAWRVTPCSWVDRKPFFVLLRGWGIIELPSRSQSISPLQLTAMAFVGTVSLDLF